MKSFWLLGLSLFGFLAAGAARADDTANADATQGGYDRWLDSVTETQSEQPHWVTPLATVTARLEQEFRTDFTGQPMKSGHTLYNFGGGKGLELIPFSPVEVLINVPPYLEHHSRQLDGFGDFSFLIKYRILAANEDHGDYILTAFLGMTLPTGTAKNGAETSVVTPTVAGGKGFGPFSIQTTFGVSLPTNENEIPGHNYLWNTALQFHLPEYHFWPEIEDNYTHYSGGVRDGNTQNFITPALMFGRFTIHERTAFTFGGGYQIATSAFNTYNHAWIASARVPF